MQKYSAKQAILRTSLGYGLGLSLGLLLAVVLLKSGAIDFLLFNLGKLQIFLRLFFSLGLIVLIIGLGGAVGGGIGGYVLAGVRGMEWRRGFILRSAASFFLTSVIMLIPVVLLTAVFGFLNPDIDVRFSKLPYLFLLFGLIYGAIVGFLLGALTVGLRRMWRILLASVAGFGAGGWLTGAGLFLLFQFDNPGRLITLLLTTAALFLFGATGGAAIGFAYQRVQDTHPLLPQTRNWRIVRSVVVIIIILVLGARAGKFIDTFTIRPASLASTMPLPTQGTHWFIETTPPELTAVPDPTPSITDSNGRTLTAACSPDGQPTVAFPDGRIEQIPFPPCQNQPVLAEDAAGELHLVWYSNQIVKVTDALASGSFLYESIRKDDGWTEPAIIARPTGVVQPALITDGDNTLHLTWEDGDSVQYATQTLYQCNPSDLNNIGQAVYNVVRQEKFRPATDPIPFCQNRFEQLVITPNPTNPRSDLPSSPNGAFDRVSEMVVTAQYEVLFTTMQWDKPSPEGSPGSVMAQAVAQLYKNVKANPDAYPRGMTVRILLGNLPEMDFSTPVSQIDYVLRDLHDAGVTEMVNEEIGWKLELANFDGAWPHAHSKFVVVDGKEGIAAGFNYSYLHLPKDHPSGLGLGMTDKGVEVTGPIAQSMMATYDDLWSGSDLISCSIFPPPLSVLDFIWCSKSTAVATHPPEVLRFYPVEGADTHAFTLTHTSAFLESDEAILAALTSAEETIDLYEVNFSLDTVCLGALLLTDFCSTEELAPPYMHALVEAMVENDVKVRALVEKTAMNGFENRTGIRWMQKELAKYGKEDNFEIKFSEGKMHDKSVLIDNELLIVGSQNFHWSAWGSPSLTEFNIATDDPLAIAEFRQEYEFQWQKGIPAQELMLGK